MEMQPGGKDNGVFERIVAHCRSLDPDMPTARERLEEAIGPELAHKLLFALGPRTPRERRAA
jgi:hypothetical protein